MDEIRDDQISAWLNEGNVNRLDFDNDDSTSNDEEDILEEPNHETESEQEDEMTDEEITENEESGQRIGNAFYVGVDKTRWSKTVPPIRGRTRRHNIVFVPPGPKGVARQKTTIEDCLSLYLDVTMIDLIVKYTNIKIENVMDKYGRVRDAKLTDDVELKAFFGILYMAGALKLGRTSCKQIFDHINHTGVEAIYLTMSSQRFEFLLRHLRFDDIRDRSVRAKIDKLAPIREILDLFIMNSQQYFIPSAEMTLDEQLLAFRGRCSFKQYIPSKPAKYGVKVFALVDVHYPYTYNLEIYPGKQPEGPFNQSNERSEVVKRLTRPVLGKNRNITMDNWFSSLNVAKELFENQTTMVATVRRDKREVPKQFRVARGHPLYSSKFGFHSPCTLVSYVAKPNKVVLILSTMHNEAVIDDSTGEKRKPEMITYYNRTKNGVDLVDKMCSLYDVSRNSRRWPVTVFHDLLNLSALNALCIYSANKNFENIIRREFLISLSLAWMKPLAHRRIQQKSLPRALAFKIKDFLDIPQANILPSSSASPRSSSLGRCYECGRVRNKSTRRSCTACKKFVCPDHSKFICSSCLESSN